MVGRRQAGHGSPNFSPNSSILRAERVRPRLLQSEVSRVLEKAATSGHRRLTRDVALEWDCPGSLTTSTAV